MKKYGSLILVAILILLVTYLGVISYSTYRAEHLYYSEILSNGANWGIFGVAILSLCLPILYMIFSHNIKIKGLTIWFGLGAALFGLLHSCIKYNVVGSGWLIVMFNTLLLFFLGVYLICGFSALGSWIQRKLIKFQEFGRKEMLLSFGLGMCGFIIIVQILLGLGILYGWVSWILFLGLGFMIWYERKSLSIRGETIEGFITKIWNGVSTGNMGHILLFAMIVLSAIYCYFGIQNSFIPYSTAWDANHEYMYIPKILAENAGIYRGNTVGNTMPGLWHQFITFIFSLTGATDGWFGLAPDTFAVSMNNLSALFTLVLGIAVIFQIFSLLSTYSKNNNQNEVDKEEKATGDKSEMHNSELNHVGGISLGWFILLLWLTSGMGAFLVIVDNKTDLGVMAISLMALFAGFILLQKDKIKINKNELYKYLIIAGLFFGFATLAKVTAFVDLVLFGLLLIGLWFSPIILLGIGIIVIGLVRKFNILTSSVMLTDTCATRLIIIGGIVSLVGIILYFKKYKSINDFKKYFVRLLILGISFIVPILLFKLPRTTISQYKLGTYSVSGSIKSSFLGLNTKELDTKSLLAQNTEGDIGSTDNQLGENILSEQSIIDTEIIDQISEEDYKQCMSIGDIYSDEELKENLAENVIGDSANEDLGRYIGYGWKTFSNVPSEEKNRYNVDYFYSIFKIFFPAKESCYSFNHDARVLCNNASSIESFKINDLRDIYEHEINDKDSEAGILLKNAIDKYDETKSAGKIGFISNDLSIFYDEIIALRQYYQSHAIYSDENTVNIPYRYLVPINISFNRSLQNLSSYYTDTGFIWIIIYLLIIIALPYAIIKKDKLLTSIALTTIIGWIIRWIIGSAILWYGTVLISRSMITVALLISKMFNNKNDDTYPEPYIILGVFIGVISIIFLVQLILNFMRICSQGANSAFVRYKGSVGEENILDDNLQYQSKIKYGFGQQDLFDLQFPQYNPIIHALANRNNEDGVIVAGTYIQYFLGNQWNIKSDGMLENFWLNTSDGNLCKTYRRLKKDNIKYLIIDPNIGTVTMGEGNQSLFYRFFAKLNGDETEIEESGTITTLVKLFKSGYLKLLSTNNLGAKYAFTLSDDDIKELFGEDLGYDGLILARAKLATLQYFDNAYDLFSIVSTIFMTRIINDRENGIQDVADIFGAEIDSNKVYKAVLGYLNSSNEGIKNLSQKEREIMFAYLNIYLPYVKGDQNSAWNTASNLLMNSVTGGSQVIALELL